MNLWSRPLVIYHGNCADGFTAAWVAWRFFEGDLDLHAGVYGQPPPEVRGRNVILVDFSYKLEVMQQLVKQAAAVIILDHHKTACEDLATLEGAIKVFDMERSGAGIAWDFFFPKRPRPALLEHVEDRDLWRFKHKNTREVQAAIFSYPYEMDIWQELMSIEADTDDYRALVIEGRAILRSHLKNVDELLKRTTRLMRVGGHVVPIANLPYTMCSEGGAQLLEWGYPFAGSYYDTAEGRVFSLRSRDDLMDVGSIAVSYGGGGHRNAAGFRMSFAQAAALELEQA